VAAEVERLEKDSVRLGGLHWMLDPGLVPEGLFQPGLSPRSDLSVRHDSANGRLIIHVLLTPGAARGAANRCLARLVDPAVRRVLAQATLTKAEDSGEPSRGTAELESPFPLDEVQDGWIEVVADQHWPVHSARGHRIRHALRWADSALRAERAPAGLAPHSTPKDWAALAAAAWEHCRRDWEAAGDACNAALAIQRQVALDWTQYVITRSVGESEPLRKRQAVLTMVATLRAAGVPAREIAKAIPTSRFLPIDGTLAGAELREAFALSYPKGDASRWFMESPVHEDGRTWIVTKMWGRNTEPVLERLAKLAPEQSGIGYEAVP
jgi:hypothetical protein